MSYRVMPMHALCAQKTGVSTGVVSDFVHALRAREHSIGVSCGAPIPLSIPIYLSKVQAGFPSPADDYIERYLDLNAEYIKHPAATFMVTAAGESMIDAGIFNGDVLLVDRSLEAFDGSIVVAALDGELTVKRLSRKGGLVRLMPANPKFSPIDISETQDMVVWGVVTLVLHRPV